MALSKRYTFYTIAGNTSETVSGDFSTLLGLSGDPAGTTPTLKASALSNFLIADSANPSPTYLQSISRKGSYTTLIGNGASTLLGGAGNDFFQITSPGDILAGGATGGNDTLSSSYGSIDLSISGVSSLGNDVTMVGNAVYSGIGGATITGNNLPGILKGGSSGGNYLVAGSASQTLIGGNPTVSGTAADTLAGNGRSYLMGGSGDNLYLIQTPGDRIVQPSGSGISQILTTLTGFKLTDTLSYGSGVVNVRKLTFDNALSPSPSRAVSLTGNSLDNTIVGAQNAANSLTAGKGSRASLVAGNLNDTLIGNGFSTLVGGAGSNLYYVSGSNNGSSDIINDAGSTGFSSVIGVPQGNTPFYYALSKANNPTTNGTVTRLSYPGTANATLVGNTLVANSSRDTLAGGVGVNYLYAGYGGSVLTGGNKGNFFSDQFSAVGALTTMQGGTSNDTYYITKGNNLILDARGQYGGVDEIRTPLSYFNLSDTFVAGGVGIENLTYTGNQSANLVGNSLNNIIDATQNSVVSSGITLNGNGGFDTLLGSRVSPNTFQISNPSSLGNNFSIAGGALNDTLALTSSVNLRDTMFGNNGVRYIRNVENLQLTSPSTATLGINASASGISKVLLGPGPDTVNAAGYSLPAGITLDATSNTALGDSLVGSTVVGSAFLFSSAPAFTASTLKGGNGTVDTLSFSTPLNLDDSAFPSSLSYIDLLSVPGTSVVNIGSQAQAFGINTIRGGVGNTTLSAANFGKTVTIDVGSGTTESDSLVGSSNYGTRFVVSASQLPGSTLVAGSGIDTLSFSTAVTTSSIQFGSLSGGLEYLQLTSPSGVTLGAGFQTIAGAGGSDTINVAAYSASVTLDASQNSTSADTLVGPTVASAAGTFVFSNPTALSASSVKGGSSALDAVLMSAAANLPDSAFSRITAVEVLSLTGSSAVTLGSSSSNAGIRSVYAGNGNSTLSLVSGGASNSTLFGGGGNDVFVIPASTLSGASFSLSGGTGTETDTLTFSTAGSFADNFSRISGIEALSLTGASGVTLGAAAAAAGIQSLFGGSGNSTYSLGGTGPSAASLLGGTGNDLFILSSSNTLGSASVSGNIGYDVLFVSSAGQFNDNFSRVSGVEVLSLSGASAVTLGSAAQTTGISSVIFSNTTSSDSATLTHTSNDTLPVTATGGAGNDLFNIANASILQGDSLVGGAGADTLFLASAATLNDTLFSKVRTMEALSLTGASQVTLGSSGQTAGISTVIGGSATTSINGSAYTSSLSISNAASTVASGLFGGTAADSLIGGSGNDTLRGYSGAATSNTASDTLRGGAGADLFIMAVSGDTNNAYGRGATNTAYITDFRAGAGGDKLQLFSFGASSNPQSNYSTLTSGSNLNIYHTNVQTTANLVAVLTPTGTFDWTNNASFV